jgi:AcrR family transcriptional regulator
MALLREGGVDAVTIDAVSQVSGASKTTLYGRCTDRIELLKHVAEQVTGSALRDAAPLDRPMSVATLEAMLRALQTILTDRVGPVFLGDILVRTDDYVAVWREKLVRPEMDTMSELFAQGVADGVLREDANYSLVVELILGGLVAAGALHHGVPDEWAHDMAATLWPLVAVAPDEAQTRPRAVRTTDRPSRSRPAAPPRRTPPLL